VISIQLSKNNALQGAASNALILPIIPSKKKNSSKKKKPKTQEKTTITFTLHNFWHHDGLKFSSHVLLTPKLLLFLKLQCFAKSC
jgi:hypothetical protein